MIRKTDFNCLPTAIGSTPHKDPVAACRDVVHYLPQIPAWPQLPLRSFLESQYAQCSEGFPGFRIVDDKFILDRSGDFDSQLEQLYQRYLSNEFDKFPTSREYAAGLHELLAMRGISPIAVKGQITGPITFGLGIADAEQRPIIYDDTIADALAKFLRMKASWQEKALSSVSRRTIIFVDEPSMSYFGSAFVSLSRERVLSLLNEVFSGISGTRGVHCCSNTDWPVLLESDTDVISFDAYGYAREFCLYPTEVAKFLKRGGAIAWGIVPNNEDALKTETVASLRDRWDEALGPFARKGIPYRQLLEQSLLTPSCSLSGLTIDGANQAMLLLSELSKSVRQKHSL